MNRLDLLYRLRRSLPLGEGAQAGPAVGRVERMHDVYRLFNALLLSPAVWIAGLIAIIVVLLAIFAF